jgi:hypothetical protein
MVERDGVAPQLGLLAGMRIAIAEGEHELPVAHTKDREMPAGLTGEHFFHHTVMPVTAVGRMKVVGSRSAPAEAMFPEGLTMLLKLGISLLDAGG